MFRRLAGTYRDFFFPKPDKPPYLHVCQIGDPVLRISATSIPQEDISSDRIQKVVKQLVTVMNDYKTVGMSAPQIGIPLRIITLKFSTKDMKCWEKELIQSREMSLLPLTIIINPVVKVKDYTILKFPEACESVRGYCGDTPRYRAVDVQGLDPFGQKLDLSFIGWNARIVQHEAEHLDGKLYIDKMDSKTFENSAWHKINVRKGRVKVVFHP